LIESSIKSFIESSVESSIESIIEHSDLIADLIIFIESVKRDRDRLRKFLSSIANFIFNTIDAINFVSSFIAVYWLMKVWSAITCWPRHWTSEPWIRPYSRSSVPRLVRRNCTTSTHYYSIKSMLTTSRLKPVLFP
jgi:hypothetical protein